MNELQELEVFQSFFPLSSLPSLSHSIAEVRVQKPKVSQLGLGSHIGLSIFIRCMQTAELQSCTKVWHARIICFNINILSVGE